MIFDPLRADSPLRAFFLPIAQASGDRRQGAAWLAAHEVGHCLDNLERQRRRAKTMRWQAQDAWAVGLQPDAFQRAFGSGLVATAAYSSRADQLHRDLAQQQAQERIADAFAVLWVWRLGGADAVLDTVSAVRGRDTPTNAHATQPALALLPALKPALEQTRTLEEIWQLARQVQRQAGVHPDLGPGSTLALKAPATVEREQTAPRQPAQPPRSKGWNALPRFGAPPRR